MVSCRGPEEGRVDEHSPTWTTPAEFEEIYGLFPEEMVDIVKEVEASFAREKERLRTGTIRHAVQATIYFLRHNCKLRTLLNAFGGSRTTLYEKVKRVLIHLRSVLDTIISVAELDKGIRICGTLNCIGNLDCTSSYRNRVNPGQKRLYRGDHRRHALTTQLLVDQFGYVLDVVVAFGHNNDLQVLAYSGLVGVLRARGFCVLVDGGYETLDCTVAPESFMRKRRMFSNWNSQQAAARTVVERVNGNIKNWRIVGEVARIFEDLHAIAIVVACNLHNFRKIEKPDPKTAFEWGRDMELLVTRRAGIVRGHMVVGFEAHGAAANALVEGNQPQQGYIIPENQRDLMFLGEEVDEVLAAELGIPAQGPANFGAYEEESDIDASFASEVDRVDQE